MTDSPERENYEGGSISDSSNQSIDANSIQAPQESKKNSYHLSLNSDFFFRHGYTTATANILGSFGVILELFKDAGGEQMVHVSSDPANSNWVRFMKAIPQEGDKPLKRVEVPKQKPNEYILPFEHVLEDDFYISFEKFNLFLEILLERHDDTLPWESLIRWPTISERINDVEFIDRAVKTQQYIRTNLPLYLSNSQGFFTTFLPEVHRRFILNNEGNVAYTGTDRNQKPGTQIEAGQYRKNIVTATQPRDSLEEFTRAFAAKTGDPYAQAPDMLSYLDPLKLQEGIERMRKHLQKAYTSDTLPEILHAVGIAYAEGIKTHPFPHVNNSPLMELLQTTLQLKVDQQAELNIKPRMAHSVLDHLAARLKPENFARFFSYYYSNFAFKPTDRKNREAMRENLLTFERQLTENHFDQILQESTND